MEVHEIREQLQAAQLALQEATKVDQLARAEALRTECLDDYLRGSEATALAAARSEFFRLANWLVIATGRWNR